MTEEKHFRWLDAAREAMAAGDDARARRLLMRLRRSAPEMPELFVTEGELATLDGEPETAIARFEAARERAPEWATPAVYLAEVLLREANEPEAALDLAEDVLAEWPDDEAAPLARFVRAAALMLLERDAEARAALGEVDTDEPDTMCELGSFYMDLGEPVQAAGWFARAVEAAPTFADAWHHLGQALHEQDRRGDAADAWLECRRLDRAGRRPAWRLGDDRIEALAESTLRELPHGVRDALEDVPIFVEDAPSEALVREGLDPRVLGLFTGTPLPDKETMGGHVHAPDAVQIFVRNLERICVDREELEEQLRITILHETAHFFGLEDEDLELIGLG